MAPDLWVVKKSVFQYGISPSQRTLQGLGVDAVFTKDFTVRFRVRLIYHIETHLSFSGKTGIPGLRPVRRFESYQVCFNMVA